VWVYDIARNTSQRLTFGGINLWPKWTPDGTRIAYANPRTSFAIFYVRSTAATSRSSPQSGPYHHAGCQRRAGRSPDGTVLSFLVDPAAS
jgi:Tol biopolymer transport system component